MVDRHHTRSETGKHYRRLAYLKYTPTSTTSSYPPSTTNPGICSSCLPIPLHGKQIRIKVHNVPRNLSENSYQKDPCYSITVKG